MSTCGSRSCASNWSLRTRGALTISFRPCSLWARCLRQSGIAGALGFSDHLALRQRSLHWEAPA
eukprot:5948717-Prymnesium_polylepis.1